MKPKTKLQKRVAELSSKLPKCSSKVNDWAKDKVVDHNGYRTKKLIYCTECGRYFENTGKKDGMKEVCPYCNTALNLVTSQRRTDKNDRFFCIVDKCEDFQVFRYVYIQRINKKEKPAHYFFDEVMQKWMSPDERITIVAKKRLMNSTYIFDCWSHVSEMELRETGRSYYSSDYNLSVSMTYPIQKWLDIYKKFGIQSGKTIKADPHQLFRLVKHEPKAETLLKAKQYGLLWSMANSSLFVNKHWATIKICFRNKYMINDVSMYTDYINLLERYDKDLHNAHYVCPKNLRKAHDLYVAKRNKELAEEKRKRQHEVLLKQKKFEKEFIESKGKFFDLTLSDGKIVVVVLKSLEEFKQEGDAMRHCVFTNEYFKKKDSLILSARIGEKHIETIEISLKTFNIIQCQGVCNHNSTYHNRIVGLVKKNMNIIRNRSKKNNHEISQQRIVSEVH